jgi:hypothetical protein
LVLVLDPKSRGGEAGNPPNREVPYKLVHTVHTRAGPRERAACENPKLPPDLAYFEYIKAPAHSTTLGTCACFEPCLASETHKSHQDCSRTQKVPHMCVAQLSMGFAMPFQKGRIGYCATFCVLCVARECSRGRSSRDDSAHPTGATHWHLNNEGSVERIITSRCQDSGPRSRRRRVIGGSGRYEKAC